MRKKLLRFLRVAPLALLFAGVASAQTTGTIIGVVTDASTGKPVVGAVIIAKSPNLQGEQTAVTDAGGGYRLSLLPAGQYTLAVQLDGYKPAERSDIAMRPDKTIRANLAVVPEAVQMEEQVVRTGAAPVVNIGSAEAGSTISREFMSSIPVGRGFDTIALVAPTAKTDATGVGFAGAQGVENQYVIDGLNTTDPAFGGRAGDQGSNGPPSLRSNFTQEIDVKTGGFGAEYGRATGGILNVVLKSGSNEFHGSAFSSFTPNFLVSPNGVVIGSAGEAIAFRQKPGEGTYGLDLGFEVGGPIMKDKLWFYAGFSPVIQNTAYERYLRQNATPLNSAGGVCPAGTTDDGPHGECVNATGDALQTKIPGTSRIVETNRTTYQMLGKLTYLLDENNSFTLTGWGTPSSRNFISQNFAAGGSFFYSAPSREKQWEDDGQISLLGRYGGKFFDKKLITEVQGGWYNYTTTPINKTVAGVNQFQAPAVEFMTDIPITSFESVPAGYCDPADPAACPVFGYVTGGRGGNFPADTDRLVGKATAAYLFDGAGQHQVKGGVDLERLIYKFNGGYTGGAWYTYAPATATAGALFSAFRGYGTIANPLIGPGGVPGIEIANALPGEVNRIKRDNTSQSDSFAYFLQDSWQPGFLPNVTVNAGLRLETQSMKNLDVKDSTGFTINDNWSPRVQAIWDFTGTGRGKVAGSWGRFYYAMPLDMGNRAFGNEISLRYNLDAASCGFTGTGNFSSFDTRLLDNPLFQNGTNPTLCTLRTRGGDNNDLRLTGSNTPADPNLKGQFVDQFGGQIEYELLSDLSVGLDYQARRQGYVIEDMSSNDGGNYFIGNPGKNADIRLPDGTIAGNSKTVTTFDPNTGKEVVISFPTPERSYDGLTFKATKIFSKNWLAQASYTYSVLRGNYSGPYYPEYGQLDPGITAEYDLASLMGNKNGYLPGDQTHQFKLAGAYTWNFGPRVNVTASGVYTGLSGTPVSALGSHPDYGSGSSFIIPRAMAGRTPFTNTVDVGAAFGYTIQAPYAVNFRVDIFNLFNSQEITAMDENYTFDTVTPVSGIDCKSRNSVSKGDPIAALQRDCPGLATLKTVEGRPITVNPNFGKAQKTATANQAPLSMRLSVAVTF